jgi:hypothetical protein
MKWEVRDSPRHQTPAIMGIFHVWGKGWALSGESSDHAEKSQGLPVKLNSGK